MTIYPFYQLDDVEQAPFYRVPKALFVDEAFAELSNEAKLLYGVLLDRMQLSLKNGWVEDGKVYLVYPIAQLCLFFHTGKSKITKLLRELEIIGLLTRKRKRLGHADLLFLHKISTELSTNEFSTATFPQQNSPQRNEFPPSVGVKIDLPKACKSAPNKNNQNKTDWNKTDWNNTSLCALAGDHSYL